MKLNQEVILAERLNRQGLAEPLENPGDEEAYKQLFRALQPVAPIHFTRPGDPPSLVHRTRFGDYELSSKLRERGQLVKARFQEGRVAYVLEEDLKLYATAFRKPMARTGKIHEDSLALIRETGGMSKDQLKEETPYKAGEIGKALQDMQKAFVVYEQQTDTDWDTGWLDFAEEWFEVPDDEESVLRAREEVILRFTKAMVFTTEAQIISWSGWSGKIVKVLINGLVEQRRLAHAEATGWGNGLLCEDDVVLSGSSSGGPSLQQHIWMLDKSDFLVRADLDELKKRYEGLEVLQYLLVDGVFNGVVLGHWGFKDYDIDDVIVDLPTGEAAARRDEALSAVREFYKPSNHTILKYNGMSI